MRDETPDPRIDRMVAALYGELSEAEERAFQRLLEKDPELRAEYEELSGTRAMLADWELEERAPSFVLVEEPTRESEPGAERRDRRTAAGAGWLERTRDWIQNLGARPVWGLATAAVAVLVLALAGFRVERLDGGFAFRFGEAAPRVATTSTPPPAGLDRLGPGRTLDGFSADDIPFASGDGSLVPVSSDGYLSRTEYDRRNEEFMISLAALLNEFGERRDEEVGDVLRNHYLETRSRQDQDYRELNRRIDQLGFQVLRDAGYDPGEHYDPLRGPSTDRSVPLELIPNETKE